VHKAAAAAGIPARTLERVKAAIGVRSDAIRTDGRIEWWWRDPHAPLVRDHRDVLPPLDTITRPA
jgi:hypothetical protein